MLIARFQGLAIVAALLLSHYTAAQTAEKLIPAKDCTLAGQDQGSAVVVASAPLPFPPVQLDTSVPFEPTLVPSGGLSYLIYELHLQNYTDGLLNLQALEIVDTTHTPYKTVAIYTGSQLAERLRAIGAEKIDAEHPLEGGKRAVALICLAFEGTDKVPEKLAHRLLVGDLRAEGPMIATRHVQLKTLAPPVLGGGWSADNGPSLHSHHRTGVFVAGGSAFLSRRFAIDWKKKDDKGEMYAGDALDVRSYYSYGEKVLAVADATVVSAIDGFPDNIPRTAAGFNTALLITMENLAGNAVVLDLGDGQFAYYAHMKPGSIRVKVGDRVKRGTWLGQIGNSGDARWPHLHFQVTAGPRILASEGLPFVLDQYRAKGQDGRWQMRTGEYPIGDIQLEFGMASPTALK